MSLTPLPVEDLQDLLMLGSPSPPQYAAYWGQTSRERYSRALETVLVTLMGIIASSFLAFVVGGFVATLLGSFFCLWGILAPELKTRQRNWEFLSGRALLDPGMKSQGLYGSLLMATIEDVCVVADANSSEEYDLDEFQDYTLENDELEQLTGRPYLLRIRIRDESRQLQLHARLHPDYLRVQPGMPAATVLMSENPSFGSLAALTDVVVPNANCWVGDYPYLNRPAMKDYLSMEESFLE